MKFIPSLDPHFAPMSLVLDEYVRRTSSLSHHTLYVTVERNDGYNYAFTLPVSDSAEDLPEAKRMAERMVKSVLWVVGGFKVYVAGDKDIFDHIHSAYSPSGTREFDYYFMQRVYEKPFEVLYVEVDQLPPEKKCTMAIGGHLDGCRIGFDAGGSDRKVSAVIDGEVVYSEEVVWSPKLMSDPNYHYGEILTAMKTAASKMPRVDAIGVSSAGVYVNNRIMVASLFVKVSDEDFERQVKTMYIDVAREMGEDIPLEVANDGDVTALAGAQELGCGKVLGVAMGTSEAVGYINAEGGLNG
ncbi:MAG: ROK family protein, partial [Clostridia bacterium]|nr:ROK family protein [Clostridia bacterium]